MVGAAPRVILDPVHNLIPFEGDPIDTLLWKLIDTPEFQRLRRIKQLGMADLVFPGATHTRFSHSIGVMHMARSFLDTVERHHKRLGEKQRAIVLVAALLHDIGHGPFSHAFEAVTKQKHEHWTHKIICDPSTEINGILKDSGLVIPEDVVSFFYQDSSSENDEMPGFLTHIIASQLDADRFDYLLRDSLAMGTQYGRFDYHWLILNLRIDNAHNRFYLTRKACSAVEAYLFARYHMYRQIYFHKTKRSAEIVLRLAFQRAKELIKDNERSAEDMPISIQNAFSSQSIEVKDFLTLDDSTVAEFLKWSISAEDELLKYLGNALINRRLYKSIDVTDNESAYQVYADARDIARGRRFGEQYSLIDDSAVDTPYKPYNPDAEHQATQIFVETPKGTIEEISKLGSPVHELTREFRIVRYYFPQEMKAQMNELAQ
ncbi:MAG TPA: HD domain-containing protein [bacterium]|nr:HD domain-containing protein [bacterium]